MAWIESHDNLSRHPKTRRAARMLGVSIPTIMGHLHLLWHWCLEYADDGNLSPYDAHDIADAVMWEGEPDDLISALLNCGPGDKAGFLEQGQDGWIVHDWMDYAGKLVAKREEARESGARGNHERWHTQRGVVDPECQFCQEEHQRDRPSSGGDRVATRDPIANHRTVPNQTKQNQDIPGAHTREDNADVADVGPDVSEKKPSVRPSVSAIDDRWSKVTAAYHAHIGMLGPSQMEKLRFWHDDKQMSADVIVEAIVAASDAGKTRISYVEGILRNWHNDGIVTADEAREARKPRSRGSPDAGDGAPNATAYHSIDQSLVDRWLEMYPDEYDDNESVASGVQISK